MYKFNSTHHLKITFSQCKGGVFTKREITQLVPEGDIMLINHGDEHYYFMSPSGNWSRTQKVPDVSLTPGTFLDSKWFHNTPCDLA